MAKTARLDEVVEAFHRQREGDGVRDNTRKNDRVILNRFLTETGNIYTKSITEVHVDRYFTAVASGDHALAPSTINTHVGVLQVFFRFCRAHGYIGRDDNPMGTKKRSRKVMPTDRYFIPVDRFQALLGAARHPRDRVLIALGLYLFLRQSEAATILLQDVDFTNSTVRVIIHKTTDVDHMPMSAELESELRRWMSWYAQQVGTLEPDMHLVPAIVSNPWRGEAGRFMRVGGEALATVKPYRKMVKIEQAVQRAMVDLGMPTHFQGCHTLRRSGARARFDALKALGYDGALQHVRAMLHHATGTMTERYLGINIERKQRDDMIKGQVMFPSVAESENVIRLTAIEG